MPQDQVQSNCVLSMTTPLIWSSLAKPAGWENLWADLITCLSYLSHILYKQQQHTLNVHVQVYVKARGTNTWQFYHLKNIARIRSFVYSQDLEKHVHAFITSRVDYCNGLLAGLPKKTVRQLQLILNTAARILTRTRKSEHITPVLRSLHLLPVTFRIDFKVLLLVYKSLNGPGLNTLQICSLNMNLTDHSDQ